MSVVGHGLMDPAPLYLFDPPESADLQFGFINQLDFADLDD
jgi:hypothetical protein